MQVVNMLDWDLLQALLLYACGVFTNMGNYKSFGDTKFIPGLEKVCITNTIVFIQDRLPFFSQKYAISICIGAKIHYVTFNNNNDDNLIR